MISQISAPRLKGHRFPRSIISYAVWAYYRFSLSLRDVEDLLAERGIVVSYEAIRAWVGKFGPQIAKRVRATRPRPTDKWHLDEVVIMINGVRQASSTYRILLKRSHTALVKRPSTHM